MNVCKDCCYAGKPDNNGNFPCFGLPPQPSIIVLDQKKLHNSIKKGGFDDSCIRILSNTPTVQPNRPACSLFKKRGVKNGK